MEVKMRERLTSEVRLSSYLFPPYIPSAEREGKRASLGARSRARLRTRKRSRRRKRVYLRSALPVCLRRTSEAVKEERNAANNSYIWFVFGSRRSIISNACSSNFNRMREKDAKKKKEQKTTAFPLHSVSRVDIHTCILHVIILIKFVVLLRSALCQSALAKKLVFSFFTYALSPVPSTVPRGFRTSTYHIDRSSVFHWRATLHVCEVYSLFLLLVL